MPCSNAGPMLGRRTGYGDQFASDRREVKLAERSALRRDIAAELIAEHAITPGEPRRMMMYADAAIAWGTEVDHEDFYAWLDETGWDDDDAYRGFDDEDAIDAAGTPITDQDIPGGWGTGIAWEDLSGLTITKRPYLWSTGKEAST